MLDIISAANHPKNVIVWVLVGECAWRRVLAADMQIKYPCIVAYCVFASECNKSVLQQCAKRLDYVVQASKLYSCAGTSIIPIEIQDSKDTRDSSFSAKSSRHFESRSSLHVSDLAALTIHAVQSRQSCGLSALMSIHLLKYIDHTIRYPCFLKPPPFCGSVGQFVIRNKTELESALKKITV